MNYFFYILHKESKRNKIQWTNLTVELYLFKLFKEKSLVWNILNYRY